MYHSRVGVRSRIGGSTHQHPFHVVANVRPLISSVAVIEVDDEETTPKPAKLVRTHAVEIKADTKKKELTFADSFFANRLINFGLTPWDVWSQEDLARELQKSYIALRLARETIAKMRIRNAKPTVKEDSDAQVSILAIDDALARTNRFVYMELYTSFFRWATPMLMPSLVGTGPDYMPWYICAKCLMTTRALIGEPNPDGSPCVRDECNGKRRKLNWTDLKRKEHVQSKILF